MDTSARHDQQIRLLRRGTVTSVGQIANELGVSRRTVLRDISALRDRGFVIDGDAGRGGGVRMDPQSVLVSAQFTTDEVVSLILSVSVLRSIPWIPFTGLAEQALAKIEGALPKERIRELRRLMSRILVGDPLVPAEAKFCGPLDTTLLTTFERAFNRRCALNIDYKDRIGRLTKRVIEPHAMLLRAPLWYIVAWDIEKDAVRQFRMDRIVGLTMDTERSFGPRPIELVIEVCPDAKPVAASKR